MKRRLRHRWVFLGLFLLCQAGQSLLAQSPQTLEIGPHGGITTYLGDINAWKMFDQFDYELGGVVRYNYDSRWSFRLDYSYQTIKGTDAKIGWRPERNLGFKTWIHDLSMIVEFNFLEYYTGRPGTSISPYLFGGVSLLMFEAYPYTGNMTIDTVALTPLSTEQSLTLGNLNDVYFDDKQLSTPSFAFSIPFGFGCKFSLSKHLATTLEWRMHWTSTDYLDDVHGVYPSDDQHALLVLRNGEHVVEYGDPSQLNGGTLVYDFSDPSGKFHHGQQRGNSQSNDWFGSLNVSLTWKFEIPKKSPCNLDF